MFMDVPASGEPHLPTCRSCQAPIWPGQTRQEITFPANDPHNLAEMNGDYHTDCAKPLLSVKRAYDMLGRWG